MFALPDYTRAPCDLHVAEITINYMSIQDSCYPFVMQSNYAFNIFIENFGKFGKLALSAIKEATSAIRVQILSIII